MGSGRGYLPPESDRPSLLIMTETKFIITGRWERPNGHQMRDELSYIKATKQEAIATCQRLNPHFHIHTVREEM